MAWYNYYQAMTFHGLVQEEIDEKGSISFNPYFNGISNPFNGISS